MKNPGSIILLFALAHSASILFAKDISSWRNGGNGLYTSAQPPLHWDNPENLLWKVDTPDWGNACPLVIGDRLIYTAEPAMLVCVDRRNGKELWRVSNAYEDVADLTPAERATLQDAKKRQESIDTEIAELNRELYKLNRRLQRDKDNAALKQQQRTLKQQIESVESKSHPMLKRFEKPKTHSTNGYASFTPCSDGKYIYACNGLGIVTKHDLEGNRVWAKVMERPDHNWGGSISPILVEDKLIVRIADYAALDPQTGKELWRVEDPHTFGPPASFKVEGRSYLYTCRGELIRVSDGKKLPSQDWTIEQKTFAFFNTPFVAGNRVYVVHGAAGIQGDLYCMEIPDTAAALERDGLKQAWYAEVSKERYYASPLVHQGLVYINSMGNVFQVLEADTGKPVYGHKMEGRLERAFPGLLLVNNLIYAGEENGNVFFLKPGRQYEEVSRFNVGECRSTPVFQGNVAYLRAKNTLFAFTGK